MSGEDMEKIKSNKKLMIVVFLVLAFVAYKGLAHFHGQSGSTSQDPEVEFYYAVRDKVATMNQDPACQSGARAMTSMASPANSWPLDVRKAQVEKVIDALPDYCFAN